MATTQSLLGLVTQLHHMELSFTTVLMETAMKLCSLTDASVFLLVETQEGRRFSGKRHLCDAYLRGSLNPLASDVELEVDPSICALHQRQVSLQSVSSVNLDAAAAALSKMRETNGPRNSSGHRLSRNPLAVQTPNVPVGRKRPSVSEAGSNDGVKSLKLSLSDFAETKEELAIKLEASQSPIVIEGVEAVEGCRVLEEDDEGDVAIIVEEYLPESRSLQSPDGDRGVVLAGNPFDATVSKIDNPLPNFNPALGKLHNKLTALQGFSLSELTGEHPVASKIFKSCLYDFAKTCANEFGAFLTSTKTAYVPAEGNDFIRQQFQHWVRENPLIHDVYSSKMKLTSKRPEGNSVSSDSTMWNYVRNAFSINLKRQLKLM